MPYIRIWIHLIWATKDRGKLISRQLNPKLISHIRENAIDKNIHIDFLNCVENHCHALISLGSSQSIQEIARLMKGESSHWVNQKKLSGVKFEWQDEYIAVSI
ncbi:MAG: transposase, partial [Calditrichaeota bacterium]|nr:transposase [Calditrichota bacterium]